MKRLFLVAIIASTLPVSFVESLRAYVLTGSRWPSPATSMYISIGSPWDSAFINAMALWNQSTVFRYTYFSQYADPCSNPNTAPARNGVNFSDTVCGQPWGSTTLATTRIWSSSSGATTIQADVIFNSNWKWNVYNGPYA